MSFETWYAEAHWGNEDFREGCRRAYAEGQRAFQARALVALCENEQFYARDTVRNLEIEE